MNIKYKFHEPVGHEVQAEASQGAGGCDLDRVLLGEDDQVLLRQDIRH